MKMRGGGEGHPFKIGKDLISKKSFTHSGTRACARPKYGIYVLQKGYCVPL